MKVGVVGATGYSGAELIRILLGHPKVKIRYLASTSRDPLKISDVFGAFRGRLDLTCQAFDRREACRKADFFFLALPHGASMMVAPQLLESGRRVVDLSADFRLATGIFEHWYGIRHQASEWVSKAVYGLTEMHREKIRRAWLVANPGCYPASAILALAPLMKRRMVGKGPVIIDSKSGVTGAGRKPTQPLHFSEVSENFRAYKVDAHQHAPEMNQELTKLTGHLVSVVFTPHLVPMNRGILTVVYAPLAKRQTTESVQKVYHDAYGLEPFVRVLEPGRFPETRAVWGTNFCDIGVKVNEAHGLAIIVSAIDNLGKGAAGQAVQNMNVMLGFPETCGL